MMGSLVSPLARTQVGVPTALNGKSPTLERTEKVSDGQEVEMMKSRLTTRQTRRRERRGGRDLRKGGSGKKASKQEKKGRKDPTHELKGSFRLRGEGGRLESILRI